MIPITRKENYLNEIVGWGETAPEKPLTPEEFFFAAILGEVVQTPEPLSRYQIYLAKIAGRNISVPKPLTRLELFLAKACGMDIETPTPITREEIFWSNYSAIVEFEVEGVPPLTYKAIEGTLENYRIYGDTVDGESVGDLVTSGEHAGEYKVPVTVEGKNLFSSRIEQGTFDGITGVPNNSSTRVRSHEDDYIFLTPGVYKISAMGVEHLVVYAYDLPDVNAFNYNLSRTNWASLPSTITINTSAYYKFAFCKTNNPIITPSDVSNIMLNTGSTALPYEPYHTPVTTPIYLPEPIKMIGDEAEYIDYAEQKQHRVRKNLWDGEIESGSWLGFNDDEPYKVDYNLRCRSSKLIAVKNSSVYTISNHEPSTNVQVIVQYRDNNKKFINEYGWVDFPCTFTTPSNAACIEFIIRKPSNLEIMPEDCGDIQLELGSTATEYEPYIENTDVDVTLPALPTLPGTNVLSVGTAVQPSKVYVKYKGERQ